MKIYTKTGDAGETGLFGGPRVKKHDPRIEAYGTIDELNAALGLVRCDLPPGEVESLLSQIQSELFDVGAQLATPDPAKHQMQLLGQAPIRNLEQAIDQFEAQLPLLKQFILPGGVRAAAGLHLARCICRRAERRMVALAESESISAELIVYVNRLSDLLFVLARAVNQQAGAPDVPWQKKSPS